MKQIAKLAGVSRGTVDRVLNNRGSVNPDTERKIREIAQAVNYTPNLAGKTLALKKKQLKLGYIIFSSTTSNPFFEDVVRGIENKADELSEFGVTVEIRYAAIDNPELQASLIDQLIELGIDGLVIVPINHPIVVDKIKSLTNSGFPVVTSNSDVPDCGRISYVGSDYYKSGETAAGLMNLITGGRANTGIIIGSPLVLCHSQRAASFQVYAKRHFPDIHIIDKAYNNDDDFESYSVTKALLEKNPDIDSLFLASAGVYGSCRAVKDMGLAKELKIVSYDATEKTCELVREGVISATIAQQPIFQGSKPLEILVDYLGMDIKPDKEYYYTDIEIKISENL